MSSKEKEPEKTLTREEKLTEKISMYHKDIQFLSGDKLLIEIATNLFAIFLQLKELTFRLEEAAPK